LSKSEGKIKEPVIHSVTYPFIPLKHTLTMLPTVKMISEGLEPSPFRPHFSWVLMAFYGYGRRGVDLSPFSSYWPITVPSFSCLVVSKLFHIPLGRLKFPLIFFGKYYIVTNNISGQLLFNFNALCLSFCVLLDQEGGVPTNKERLFATPRRR
jgi:hypothetical protein